MFTARRDGLTIKIFSKLGIAIGVFRIGTGSGDELAETALIRFIGAESARKRSLTQGDRALHLRGPWLPALYGLLKLVEQRLKGAVPLPVESSFSISGRIF